MDRRKFLSITATSAGGLLILPGFLGAKELCRLSRKKDGDSILVFIQLNGGNDGLNTFIPFDDPLYYEYRPKIGIPKEMVINKTQGMGLHPALKGFSKISQDGNLSIIQNVGYPNPNRSHFRSQEIWQTASGSDVFLTTGWLGRYLDIQCKDKTIPSLNIEGSDNLALRTQIANNITFSDFRRLNIMISNQKELKLSDNPQLDFVRRLEFASSEGIILMSKALDKSKKSLEGNYPPNILGNRLLWMSKLIKGELESRIYYTSLSGFDTHSNQLGMHQRQLTILDEAVYAFYEDLKNSNLIDRVTIVVFSEFGRRVKENGTGTDHGAAGPMFIIGGKNKGKIIGSNPNLGDLERGDIKFKHDFRSVYGALLKDKLQFNPELIGIQQEPLHGLF
jgi:uncharacterized protein (DUF1501 family)